MSPVSDIVSFRTGRWKLEWFLAALRRAVQWAIDRRAAFDFLRRGGWRQCSRAFPCISIQRSNVVQFSVARWQPFPHREIRPVPGSAKD
jgi:hypothetical protein